jgi:prepilin-type processing-associated H-X9-DG protein
MLCPSAGTDSSVFYTDDDEGTTGTALGHLTKANYVACFGGGTMLHTVPTESVRPRYGDLANIPVEREGGVGRVTLAPPDFMVGIFQMVRINKDPATGRLGKGTKAAQIPDGLSNTVLLSEVVTWDVSNSQGDGDVGSGNDDWRGVWMVPAMGASAFSGWLTPNSKKPDVICACGTGLKESPDYAAMPCQNGSGELNANAGQTYAAARSRHSQGVNAAMADASVRFIEDEIDDFVWQAMCTRSGQETVDTSAGL